MATLIETNVDDAFTNTPVTGEAGGSNRSALVQYVMSRVNSWRDARDTAWQDVWGEWYRLWRGRHIDADKTYSSERSKLVAPALAQALEMTVSELEEAAFGRQQWIDVLDDDGDPDHTDINGLRRMFIQDMENDNIPSSICEGMLCGGLWGTLAAKIIVEKGTKKQIIEEPLDPQKPDGEKRRYAKTIPCVDIKWVNIPVLELVPDPEGETIEDMHGVAHESVKTPAWLMTQPWGKTYAKKDSKGRSLDYDWRPEMKDPEDTALVVRKGVLITEYHGLVPAYLLAAEDNSSPDPLADALVGLSDPVAAGPIDKEELVEAIVTIADKSKLLRFLENPFYMKDRSIFGCAFEKVPGRFHGRGVMEKGQNPQRALDAELRARMDAMALISNPMLAADQTKLPRGFDLRVRPGKVWLVQGGKPQDALMPIQFPGLDPASFSQTSEMERMVQMGTGAMDSATPIGENRRNETATGTSLIAGTFVKRCKRSLRHITKNFIDVGVRKILWRRMQYDPSKYPVDMEFQIVSTLGIVARELEQASLAHAMSMLQPGSTPQLIATKAYFDNTSSPYKAEMVKAIQESMVPSEEQQQARKMQQAAQMGALQKLQLENGLLQAETLLNMAKVQVEMSKPGIETEKLRLAYAQLSKDLEEAQAYRIQSHAIMINAVGNVMHGGAKAKKDAEGK